MNKKIVLVEDEKWQAAHYKRVLDLNNFETFVAYSAYEAIDIIDEQKPAAIVLDLLLSGTTGLTLLHELQSHGDLANIPVIVATNSSEQVTVIALKPYGVAQILDKTTMHPNDVVSAVKRVVS